MAALTQVSRTPTMADGRFSRRTFLRTGGTGAALIGTEFVNNRLGGNNRLFAQEPRRGKVLSDEVIETRRTGNKKSPVTVTPKDIGIDAKENFFGYDPNQAIVQGLSIEASDEVRAELKKTGDLKSYKAVEIIDDLLQTDGSVRMDADLHRRIQAKQVTPPYQETANHVASSGVNLSGLSFRPVAINTSQTGPRQCFAIIANPSPEGGVGNTPVYRAASLGGLIETLNIYNNLFTFIDSNDDRAGDFKQWKIPTPPYHAPHMILARSDIENRVAAGQICSMKNLVEGVAISPDGKFTIKAKPGRLEALIETVSVLGSSNAIVTSPGSIAMVWIAAGNNAEQRGNLGTIGRGAYTFRWSPSKFGKPPRI